MTANPQPPPEATLIAARRMALIPVLSARQAARRAGFSAALWTKIEKGYDQVARGVTIPFRGTAEKVARAAQVVGITPAELAACDRDDAARVLAALPAADVPLDSVDEMREYMRIIEQRLRRLESREGEDDEVERDERNAI